MVAFRHASFDGELTSIDGGAEGWAGSADGPAGVGSDGAANGGGDLAGEPRRRDALAMRASGQRLSAAI